jgi:hypothetical protein
MTTATMSVDLTGLLNVGSLINSDGMVWVAVSVDHGNHHHVLIEGDGVKVMTAASEALTIARDRLQPLSKPDQQRS